jgi:hypothetical protein
MDLTNEFEVEVPLAEAWSVLTDVERIAPCMPGAELREVDGDDYKGVVKIKVGPISAQYQGTARFLERDESSHRAVLRAEGRETRGQGNASATITAALEQSGTRTKVLVTTDLHITGRAAQFGRGVLADVSNKLLGQFVENLESMVLNDGSSSPSASAEHRLPSREPRMAESREASEPVDLMRVAGPAIARQLLPVAVGALVVLAVVAFIRRRVRD